MGGNGNPFSMMMPPQQGQPPMMGAQMSQQAMMQQNPLSMLFPGLGRRARLEQQQQEAIQYARMLDQYNMQRQQRGDEAENQTYRDLGNVMLGYGTQPAPRPSLPPQSQGTTPQGATPQGVTPQGRTPSQMPMTGQQPQGGDEDRGLDIRTAMRILKEKDPNIAQHPERAARMMEKLLPFMKEEDAARAKELMAEHRQVTEAQTDRRLQALEGRDAETTRHHKETEDVARARLSQAQERIDNAVTAKTQALQQQLMMFRERMSAAKSARERAEVWKEASEAHKAAAADTRNAIAAASAGLPPEASDALAKAQKEAEARYLKQFQDLMGREPAQTDTSTPPASKAPSESGYAEPTGETYRRDVEGLKKGIGTDAQFDEIYGPGAAKRARGQ